LFYEPAALRLTIEDDGRGFPAGEDWASFGIRGMGKRAESIGAAIDIRSWPGKGTTVEVKATLPKSILPASLRDYAARMWVT